VLSAAGRIFYLIFMARSIATTSAAKRYRTSSSSGSSNALYRKMQVARTVYNAASRVGAAVGRAVSNYSKSYSSNSSKKSSKNVKRMKRAQVTKKTKYFTNGKYAGRFSRGLYPRTDPYRKYGFKHVTEISGLVADPDCIYIGHSAYSGIQTIELLCQVLLKKLFFKAGMIIKDIHQPLLQDSSGSTQKWRIELFRVDKESGAVTSTAYTTIASDTIYKIVGSRLNATTPEWANFIAFLEGYANGQFGSGTGETLNILQPSRLVLYRQSYSSLGEIFTFACEVDLELETVHVSSISELKIQNRTVAASGGEEADDISNNPLVGRSYEFSSGCPRSKVANANLIESMLDASGVLTCRAANLITIPGLSEPPPPTMFWNCVKSSKIMLGAGDIKKQVITHRGSRKLLQFLKSMAYGIGPLLKKQINLFGKSGLVSLEDMINVNALANISIAYEVNREFGMYLTHYANNTSLGTRYTSVVNDTPA